MGIPTGTIIILAYISLYGVAPMVFGIQLLDGKSMIGIHSVGVHGVMAFGSALVATSLLLFVSGFWLWHSLRKAGKLWFVLLTPILFFALGFGIPALYVVSIPGTVLVSNGWRSLASNAR